MIDSLLLGFSTALSVENLLWCMIGVVAGTLIGILPGMGSSTGIAVLLPLTMVLEPVTAIIMLAGIYFGSQYGGSTASILIATPGDPASVVTTFDGYPMAQKGKAGVALAMAAIASFVAGITALVLLILLAPPFARVALSFGPPEMVAVMIVGLTIVVTLSGDKKLAGALMALLGLAISVVGIDRGTTGVPRFTFGIVDLLNGLPFVEIMIGLFALGEVFYQVNKGPADPIRPKFRDLIISRAELKRSAAPMARGSFIGFFIGCLPGAGSTLATFMSYGIEKRVNKRGSEFGTGVIEGVASPESANNAAAQANFIPTLTLGIPGGAATAVLLGAFLMHGIQPGPLLFEQQPVLVWGLIASFFIANVLLLILNLPMAPLFAQILRLPYPYMYPLIISIAVFGAYSIGNSIFSVYVVFAFGLIGYLLKRLNLPVAPLVLGLVLGPLFEKALAQTAAMGHGNPLIIFGRPVATGVLLVAVLVVLLPWIVSKVRAKRQANQSVTGRVDEDANV